MSKAPFLSKDKCLANWQQVGNCECRRCEDYSLSFAVVWNPLPPRTCKEWVDFVQEKTGHKRRLAALHVSQFAESGVLVETAEASGVYRNV